MNRGRVFLGASWREAETRLGRGAVSAPVSSCLDNGLVMIKRTRLCSRRIGGEVPKHQ